MSTSTLTLALVSIFLAVFGVGFTAFGLSSERAYWSQRDPSGEARRQATRLTAIASRAPHFAFGEFRAPLRIAAIGVLMVYLAVAVAILAAVTLI